MRGSLHDIDIRSILQLLERGQKTGELSIDAWPDRSGTRTPSRRWRLLFVNGQIAHAMEQTEHPLDRLEDFLLPSGIPLDRSRAENLPLDRRIPLEYCHLGHLLQENRLGLERLQEILTAMIRETLFDLWNLCQGSFVFEADETISPLPITLGLSPLLTEIAQQTQQWQEFSPHIRQGEQYLAIGRAEDLELVLPAKAYRNLTGWAEQKTSLRKLSRYLRRDMTTIAAHLYPYLQRGWLDLLLPASGTGEHFPTTAPEILPHILSIGNGRALEHLLELENYRHSRYSDPLAALSALFSELPDAIFCSIALSKLDGYELCHLLRSSGDFSATPIILLAQEDSPIDRYRGQIVGVTDYLDEPFGQEEFFCLLQKYLPNPPP
jgi:twitching motility two-component system response regulator PilG